MAKHILRSKEQLRSPQLMHPTRDWSIGLVVALVFFCSVAAWSAMTYLAYQDISVSNEDIEEIDIVVYRESLVKASLEEFDARTRTYEFLLAGAVSQTEAAEEEAAEAAAALESASTTNDGTASSTDVLIIEASQASTTESATVETETIAEDPLE